MPGDSILDCRPNQIRPSRGRVGGHAVGRGSDRDRRPARGADYCALLAGCRAPWSSRVRSTRHEGPGGRRPIPIVELRGVTRQWSGQGGVSGHLARRAARRLRLGPRALRAAGNPPSFGCWRGSNNRRAARSDRWARRHPCARLRRGLSMVFQSYALFPHLSCREHPVRPQGAPRAGRDRARQLWRKPSKWSASQATSGASPRSSRAASASASRLARAVVSGHPLCLMDEPLSNLDAKLRHSVRRDIKALQRRLGLTVVYVTHDQIRGDEPVGPGDPDARRPDCAVRPPQSLYEKPADVFAAEFIGDPPMAIVEGSPRLAMPQRGHVGIRVEQIWTRRRRHCARYLTARSRRSNFSAVKRACSSTIRRRVGLGAHPERADAPRRRSEIG
jgi:sn-glycerol 3-phosphate transport system ATP-binding protein